MVDWRRGGGLTYAKLRGKAFGQSRDGVRDCRRERRGGRERDGVADSGRLRRLE